jgi:hypothetical protein
MIEFNRVQNHNFGCHQETRKLKGNEKFGIPVNKDWPKGTQKEKRAFQLIGGY